MIVTLSYSHIIISQPHHVYISLPYNVNVGTISWPWSKSQSTPQANNIPPTNKLICHIQLQKSDSPPSSSSYMIICSISTSAAVKSSRLISCSLSPPLPPHSPPLSHPNIYPHATVPSCMRWPFVNCRDPAVVLREQPG